MPLPITALYVALMALISTWLSTGAARARGAAKVAVGDGGNTARLVAMRRQANFVEYVPLLMVMFAVLELNGAGAALLHGLGIALVIGRVVHPFGLNAENPATPGRIAGAGLTLVVTLVAAGVLLYTFFVA